MNRRVFLNIGEDERFLGTVREMLDPSMALAQRSATKDLWMAVSWVLAEMIYGTEDETTTTFTIEIR